VTAIFVQPAPVRPAEVSFAIGYVSEDGTEHRVPLEEAWLVPFESGRPVRRFAPGRGSGT